MEILSGWTVYAFTRIPALIDLLTTGGTTTAMIFLGLSMATILVVVGYAVDGDVKEIPKFFSDEPLGKLLKRLLKITAATCFAFHLAVAAMPSQKEVAAIYIIPKVVNNEMIQQATVNTGQGVVNLTELFKEWALDVTNAKTAISDELKNAVQQEVLKAVKEMREPTEEKK